MKELVEKIRLELGIFIELKSEEDDIYRIWMNTSTNNEFEEKLKEYFLSYDYISC